MKKGGNPYCGGKLKSLLDAAVAAAVDGGVSIDESGVADDTKGEADVEEGRSKDIAGLECVTMDCKRTSDETPERAMMKVPTLVGVRIKSGKVQVMHVPSLARPLRPTRHVAI